LQGQDGIGKGNTVDAVDITGNGSGKDDFIAIIRSGGVGRIGPQMISNTGVQTGYRSAERPRREITAFNGFCTLYGWIRRRIPAKAPCFRNTAAGGRNVSVAENRRGINEGDLLGGQKRGAAGTCQDQISIRFRGSELGPVNVPSQQRRIPLQNREI